ncbi:MAG: glycosyltransferase family 9 protein [Planctomycetota bacterium]
MQTSDNILDLLREKGAEVERRMQRGLIVQPGAIGDCILTLPLAAFMKESLKLGGVDLLGHTEYVGVLPGRSSIDTVRSIDSMDLHRLFAETKAFELRDKDPLIIAFASYAWITTFMGEPYSNFEQNLIFTANCSRSVDVTTLSLKPPADSCEHVADFYIRQFINQSGLTLEPPRVQTGKGLIETTEADKNAGRELLRERGLDPDRKLIVIHPGSGGPAKCWHMENFLAVAAKLASENIQVAFLLGPAEQDRLKNTATGKISSLARCLTNLTLTQIAGLLSCADAFVGNDSGITHLAGTLGVKTLAVFGPTNPAVYRPIGPAVTVFTSSSPAFAEETSPGLQREILDILIE